MSKEVLMSRRPNAMDTIDAARCVAGPPRCTRTASAPAETTPVLQPARDVAHTLRAPAGALLRGARARERVSAAHTTVPLPLLFGGQLCLPMALFWLQLCSGLWSLVSRPLGMTGSQTQSQNRRREVPAVGAAS